MPKLRDAKTDSKTVSMTRRNLFATLLAPLVAKFARKPKEFFSLDEFRERFIDPQLNSGKVHITELWPRDNPYLFFMEPPPRPYLREQLEISLAAPDAITIRLPGYYVGKRGSL